MFCAAGVIKTCKTAVSILIGFMVIMGMTHFMATLVTMLCAAVMGVIDCFGALEPTKSMVTMAMTASIGVTA